MILTYKILQIATKIGSWCGLPGMSICQARQQSPTKHPESRCCSLDPGRGYVATLRLWNSLFNLEGSPLDIPGSWLQIKALGNHHAAMKACWPRFFFISLVRKPSKWTKTLRSSITGWFQAAQSVWNSDRPRLTEGSMQGHQETLAQMEP